MNFDTVKVGTGSLVALKIKEAGSSFYKNENWLVFPHLNVGTHFEVNGIDVQVNTGNVHGMGTIVDMAKGDRKKIIGDGRSFAGCEIEIVEIS